MSEQQKIFNNYIGLIILFFTVYAFTRDYVDSPYKALSSLIYATIVVAVLVVVGVIFSCFGGIRKKQKAESKTE